MQKLKPQYLKTRTQEIITWRKKDGFDRNDFSTFMREAAMKAKKLQQEKEFCHGRSYQNFSSNEEVKPKRATPHINKVRKVQKQTERSENWRESEETVILPPCSNDKCCSNGGRHFIQHCPNSRKALKTNFEKRTGQRKGQNLKVRVVSGRKWLGWKIGKVARVMDSSAKLDSSLFEASSAKGKVLTKLMGDQGADTNLMPAEIFKAILEA